MRFLSAAAAQISAGEEAEAPLDVVSAVDGSSLLMCSTAAHTPGFRKAIVTVCGVCGC